MQVAAMVLIALCYNTIVLQVDAFYNTFQPVRFGRSSPFKRAQDVLTTVNKDLPNIRNRRQVKLEEATFHQTVVQKLEYLENEVNETLKQVQRMMEDLRNLCYVRS